MIPGNHIWIFNGGSRAFPGGVFTNVQKAEEWIKRHKLSGVLTAYPVDEGCFDWAVKHGIAGLKPEKLKIKQNDPDFIAGFSTATQEHYHYEDGIKVG